MANEFAMAQAAYRIGGSSDFSAVLTKLRGLQQGHLQSANRLAEELADPRGRMEREGHYNVARILEQIRGERAGHLQAADKYAALIDEIETAGVEQSGEGGKSGN